MKEELTMKQARMLRNFSREYVAKELGVNSSTILSWETNKTLPNVQQFRRMCNLYGVDSNAIFVPEQ